MPTSELLKEFGFEEEQKELKSQYLKTGYPKSVQNYTLTWEVSDLSLEEPYFWILDFLKDSFPKIEKLEDSFSASENSAFFGVTQQRLGAQQDRISQIIISVGKLVKELFQIVRELRIIKERLGYYEEAEKECTKKISERGKSAEITLKGLFVDLVQGGGKSPASVYGMARELEFITLPDLFFDAPPFKNTQELENYIEGLRKDFNKNVLSVLIRHLKQFLEWKKGTSKEHKDRYNFQKKYLTQHYEVIQMYLDWLKPYLRNVNKLSMKEKNMLSPDLIAAFEGSMLDIEILAMTKGTDIKVKNEKVATGYDCVLATFNYRTRPEMKYVQGGAQMPIHVGRMDMILRVYRWTDEELKNYKKLKQKENLMLMGSISSSLQESIKSLGEDLLKFLKEDEEDKQKKEKEEKKEEKKKPQKSFLESFLGEFYTPSNKIVQKDLHFEMKKKEEIDKFKEGVPSSALKSAWNAYRYFKKSHGMVMW